MLFDKISALCKEKGISIAKLENECGIGNSTIRKWKKSMPTVDKMKKVADFLGKPIEYFLEQGGKEDGL